MKRTDRFHYHRGFLSGDIPGIMEFAAAEDDNDSKSIVECAAVLLLTHEDSGNEAVKVDHEFFRRSLPEVSAL